VLEAIVARFLSASLAMVGRFDEANEHLRESAHVLDELDQTTFTWASRIVVAETKELMGDRPGAERELSAQWLSLRDARGGMPDQRAMVAAYHLALLYSETGRWDDASDCLSYGCDVPEGPHFARESVVRLAAEARLAAHSGELSEAVRLAWRAAEIADRGEHLNLRARVRVTLAIVQRSAGQTTFAEAATASALRLFEAKGNVAAAGLLALAAADAGT
jgi:hypothetical protein